MSMVVSWRESIVWYFAYNQPWFNHQHPIWAPENCQKLILTTESEATIDHKWILSQSKQTNKNKLCKLPLEKNTSIWRNPSKVRSSFSNVLLFIFWTTTLLEIENNPVHYRMLNSIHSLYSLCHFLQCLPQPLWQLKLLPYTANCLLGSKVSLDLQWTFAPQIYKPLIELLFFLSVSHTTLHSKLFFLFCYNITMSIVLQ